MSEKIRLVQDDRNGGYGLKRQKIYESIRNVEAQDEPLRDLDLSVSDYDDGRGDNTDGQTSVHKLHRKEFRLSGLEIYALVGALNLASSIDCLDAYGDLDTDRDIYIIALDACFAIANAIGTLSGLHATLLFSMVTMYGRTAVGLNSDSAYITFMNDTDLQRHRAFQAFSLSLYSFLVQCALLITNRMVPYGIEYKMPVLLILGLIISITIYEAHVVIDKGGLIFCPKHLTTVKKSSFHGLSLLQNKDQDSVESH